jgi:high-affinity iron transporter
MLAAGIIVFREVLEAALIIGIVLAATRGVAGSRRWVAIGIGGGLSGAMVVAASADALSAALAGVGAELFNAAILLLAVTMLAWHNAWMSRHGREMVIAMKAVGHAVAMGARPLSVLAVVVGVAVLREGAETVLFLYGVATSGDEGVALTAMGCAIGLVTGAGVGGLLYFGLLAIPTRHLFAVTSGLVTLLAAGMAAQAVHFLGAAGVIETSADPVWDSSAILAEDSLPGRLLHTLVGYVDQPTAAQLAAYVVTLIAITAMARMVRTADRRA